MFDLGDQQMAAHRHVGLVGLGLVGKALAGRLMAAGHAAGA